MSENPNEELESYYCDQCGKLIDPDELAFVPEDNTFSNTVFCDESCFLDFVGYKLLTPRELAGHE